MLFRSELVADHRGNTVRWLEASPEELKGKVVAEPSREEIDIPVEEHLIVELYSR